MNHTVKIQSVSEQLIKHQDVKNICGADEKNRFRIKLQ